MDASPLDLIQRLLVYPASSRLQAKKALHHPWFASGHPLVLPMEYRNDTASAHVQDSWDGKPLAKWLHSMMSEVVIDDEDNANKARA